MAVLAPALPCFLGGAPFFLRNLPSVSQGQPVLAVFHSGGWREQHGAQATQVRRQEGRFKRKQNTEAPPHPQRGPQAEALRRCLAGRPEGVCGKAPESRAGALLRKNHLQLWFSLCGRAIRESGGPAREAVRPQRLPDVALPLGGRLSPPPDRPGEPAEGDCAGGVRTRPRVLSTRCGCRRR